VVRNVNFWDGNDRLIIETGGTFKTFNGMANDSFYYKEPGNGYFIVYYGIQRNGFSSNHFDTIYLTGFDTTTYKIEY
jgi:hypothetical protein